MALNAGLPTVDRDDEASPSWGGALIALVDDCPALRSPSVAASTNAEAARADKRGDAIFTGLADPENPARRLKYASIDYPRLAIAACGAAEVYDSLRLSVSHTRHIRQDGVT